MRTWSKDSEQVIIFVECTVVRLICISLFLGITVSFEQQTYSVDENAGPARPVLVLSNPSSMEFSVTVFNTDGSAIGEYCSILLTTY